MAPQSSRPHPQQCNVAGQLFLLIPHLVDIVLDSLSIEDVRSFGQAVGTTTAVTRRLSVVNYLAKHFGGSSQGRALLVAMASFGVVLSGSRSLDYFIPGAARSDSDWDLYIPKEVNSIYGFMDRLASLGLVRWETTTDRVDRQLRQAMTCHEENYVTITPENLAIIGRFKRSFRKGSRLHRVLQLNRQRTEVVNPLVIKMDPVISRWSLSDTAPFRGSDDQAHYNQFSIRSGRNCSGETVQLIWYRRKAWATYGVDEDYCTLAAGSVAQVLPAIINFHSSHVQAIITGVAVAHMYWPETLAGRSYKWIGPEREKERDARARGKHGLRGWQFENANLRCVTRALTDHEGYFQILPDTIDVHASIVEHEVNALIQFTWEEANGQLFRRKGPQRKLAKREGAELLLDALPHAKIFQSIEPKDRESTDLMYDVSHSLNLSDRPARVSCPSRHVFSLGLRYGIFASGYASPDEDYGIVHELKRHRRRQNEPSDSVEGRPTLKIPGWDKEDP